ncbi:nucleotidyltransferase family protein [Thiohalorhabdus sp.]|uniref:nucleotidyltransferase family protein n=1 Tax=Thiohalorhabdus sp. TaxID=3094134 RepID=UPI002FC309A3
MIGGILLAAGQGRRFGGANKLLTPLADGTPVARAAAETLLEGGLDRCLATVRPGEGQVIRSLREAGLEVLPCSASERGMGASLAAGVAALPRADGWLVALGDMPWVAPATVAGVAQALRDGALLAAPCHAGRGGHPVGFAAALGPELHALDRDMGARSVVSVHRERMTWVSVTDPGIHRDVDEPGDIPARI